MPHTRPHSAFDRPQRVGSLEGQRGSTHTSTEGRSKSTPISCLQTSPAGQELCGLLASQPVTHAQLLPHILFELPHASWFPPPLQRGAQHLRVARASPKHAPLFSPQTSPGLQSLSAVQTPPGGHGHSSVHWCPAGGVHTPP